MNEKVRTRFAPSPTGYMHIGNLRTALYSYLFAKANDGDFIIRIEDTDQNRYVSDAVDFIYSTLSMAGIIADEGPNEGGNFGPYIQSERKGIYNKYAQRLVDEGKAYYCFCEKKGDDNSHSGYDRKCRNLTLKEANERKNNGEEYVIRQKMPLSGETFYVDEIYGEIKVRNEELDDQVLIKRDKMPTYNFANVVDDHLMQITHIIRGADFITSTPKYKLLYESFGWDVPKFAHLPLIMGKNEDGSVSKLSKRHGATNFEQLINLGYLSEAIVNYIALLGWSPKDNDEIFSMDELKNKFSLSGVSKSSSVFDYDKLDWMNSVYINTLSDSEYLKKANNFSKNINNTLQDKTNYGLLLLKGRISRFNEIEDKLLFVKKVSDYNIEDFINRKNKIDIEGSFNILKDVKLILENVSDWEEKILSDALLKYAQNNNIKLGKVMWPIRIAASGQKVTPGGATDILYILGKEKSLNRIDEALELLKNN